MTSVTVDPSTGNAIHMTEYQFLITAFDDTAYLGAMVLLYDYTGINRFFVAIPPVMASYPKVMQALRIGMMYGSMLELRRWLTSMGVTTDASELLSVLLSTFQNHTSRTTA